MHPLIPSTAFYVAADARHFPGLVGLINSLRLVGHDEAIYVGDAGLTESQRQRLDNHVTLVPTGAEASPHLAKAVAPLAHPAEVMVLVDADVIVTRSLRDLIQVASPGRVVVFTDDVAHRFDDRWPGLLGLGQLRRQPYVNSGVVVAERALGTTLLTQVSAGCAKIDVGLTAFAGGASEYPFYYLDQDVLNPVLATFDSDLVEILEHRLAPFPPFRGLRLLDKTVLRCAYEDGVEPYALHHVQAKPWLAPTHWNVYSQLLGRLLLQPDVALQLGRDEVPLRFRAGTAARIDRHRAGALASLAGMRGRLGLRRELARHMRRFRATDGFGR